MSNYYLKGFTLIELIATIFLVAILAAFAVPTFNLTGYREQGFVQQALASIRYAQKQAMNSGCEVEVNITAAGCNLTWTGDPAGFGCPVTPINNPANGNIDFCNDSDAAAGSTFPGTFTFDKIGRPSTGTVSYDLVTTTIQVEDETGYAREL